MSSAKARCLNCSSSLTEKTNAGQKSHVCQSCNSALVPTSALAKILSEYEFKKLNFEIQRAQVVSSAKCPICSKQLTKIMDLLQSNQIEACSSCQLTSINPKLLEKIKSDQLNYRKNSGKITLNPNKQNSPLEDELEETIEDEILSIFFSDD